MIQRMTPDDPRRLAFVVATKDRPNDLRNMLTSLSAQTVTPDQIVIVDSSKSPVSNIIKDFSKLNIKYLYHLPPSASAQRNLGIKAVNSEISLIGFLDDDVVLKQDAVERMIVFWRRCPDSLGGCAFNLLNPPPNSGMRLKRSSLVSWVGLYSRKKGVVVPSGWQTLTDTVDQDVFVEWLPAGASVWRRSVFEQFRFDEFYDGYSYLEDLDFSFSVGRHYKLAIVSEAGFYHYPAAAGRITPRQFGRTEVKNRLYFVRKHDLSVLRCYMGLVLRLLVTLETAIRHWEKESFGRAMGNLSGIMMSLGLLCNEPSLD